jgi:O-antigen ligase
MLGVVSTSEAVAASATPRDRTVVSRDWLLRTAAPTSVATLAAFVAAWQYGKGSSLPAYALIGAVLVGFVALAPRLIVIALLVTGASLFRPPFYPFNAGGFSTDIPEVLAFFLIGRWVIVSSLRRERPGVTKVALPIVVFVVAAVLGAFYGFANGGPLDIVKGQLKSYLIYLLVLPLCQLARSSEGRRWLERTVVWLCTAASAYIVVAYFAGLPLESDAPVLALNTLNVVAVGVERFRPALLSLLVVATLIVVARGRTEGFTPRRVGSLGLFCIVWAISFNRSTWVPLILAVLLIVWWGRGRSVPLRALRVSLVVTFALLSLGLAASGGVFGESGRAVISRATSVVSPEITNDASYVDRTDEVQAAIRTIERHPLTGVGLARGYGVTRQFYDPMRGVLLTEDRPYAHVGFLYAWLQTGLLGVSALVVFLALVFIRMRASLKTEPAADSALTLAAGTSVLVLAMQAQAQPFLVHRPSITALCISVALLGVGARTPAVVHRAPDLRGVAGDH